MLPSIGAIITQYGTWCNIKSLKMIVVPSYFSTMPEILEYRRADFSQQNVPSTI